MSPAIVCPLTYLPAPGDPVRAARIHDALKHNITLSKVDKSTLPNIYMYNGQLVEVFYPTIATKTDQPSLTATLNKQPAVQSTHDAQATSHFNFGSHFGQQGLSQPITSFSASTLTPTALPSRPSELRAANTAEVRLIDTGEVQRGGCPYSYMMTVSFADIVNNRLEWMTIDSNSNARVDFFLLIDTGGQLTTWAYSATTGIYTIQGDSVSPLNAGEERTYRDFKAKIRNNMQDPLPKRIFYAGGTLVVEFQSVSPITVGISNVKRQYDIELPGFTMGAAIGFSPGMLNYPFDGIIGLGRSYPGHNPLGMPGFVQHLFNTRRIQRPVFFVCLRYLPEPPYGHGFVAFGDWPEAEEYQPAPPFTDVSIVPGATPGKWVVKLESINIIFPGQQPKKIRVNEKVVIDSGTSQSVLPDKSSNKIRSYFASTNGVDLVIPPGTEVELVFDSLAYTGGRHYQRRIQGTAESFLLTPPLAPIGSNVSQQYAIVSSSAKTEWILGVNFFRTFIVGFDDSPDAPKVMLARQMQVPPAEE